MRRWVALALGVLVPLLGLAGTGNAQSTVQIQGTIQAVDCGQQTVSVITPDNNVNTFAVAPYTAILVNSTAVQLCDLQQYTGAPATIYLVASANQFVATRIDTAAPAPVQVSVSPLPLVGVVLGTIVLAGLVYLVVRDHDGLYYRYPYYGDYYHHYYRPEYRPYYGYYPATCPVVYGAAPIYGVVLGTIVFNNYQYLVVRDRDDRYVRYPYYGPYRAHYYQPGIRAYTGPHRDAPIHFDQWHAGAPRPYQRLDYQPLPRYPQPNAAPRPDPRPPYHPVPQYQQSSPQPLYRPYPPQPYYNRPQPANVPRPAYHPVPPYQQSSPQPLYRQYPQQPNVNRPQPANDPRPAYRRPPTDQGPGYNRAPAQYQAPAPRQDPRDRYNGAPGNGVRGSGSGRQNAGRGCPPQSQAQWCQTQPTERR